MKTWKLELAIVSVLLIVVWLLTGMIEIEIVGTAAVIFSFCFVQVATRLDESHSKNKSHEDNDHEVHCRHWLLRYLILKEVCFFIYFGGIGAWSALASVSIFLLYPFWRKYHNNKKKVDDEIRN